MERDVTGGSRDLATVYVGQHFIDVAGDDFDDVLLERLGGGERGCVAHGFFGEIEVAVSDLCEAAQVGNGIVHGFSLHGGAGIGFGVLLFFLRGRLRGRWPGSPGTLSETGVAAPKCVPGAMAAKCDA